MKEKVITDEKGKTIKDLKRIRMTKKAKAAYTEIARTVVRQSVLYRMAEKLEVKAEDKEFGNYMKVKLRGLTFFKNKNLVSAVHELAVSASRNLERLMVISIAGEGQAAAKTFGNRVIDAKLMKGIIKTMEYEGIEPIEDYNIVPAIKAEAMLSEGRFGAKYKYYIMAVAESRMERLKPIDKYETISMYKDYISREVFDAGADKREMGRYEVKKGVYLVFLNIGGNLDMHSMVWGKETPFKVATIEDNLEVLVTELPIKKKREVLSWWEMKLRVEGNEGAYVLIEWAKKGYPLKVVQRNA